MPNPPKEGPLHELGEYLELYNPEDEPVLLAGWTLDDNPEESSKPYTFKKDAVIEPHQYLVLCSGTGCDMKLRVSLNNDGEDLSLTPPYGSGMVTVTYPELDRGVVLAFSHDREDWFISTRATPGAVNVFEEVIVFGSDTIEANEYNAVRTSICRGMACHAPTTTVRTAQKIHPIDFLKKKYRNVIASLTPDTLNPDLPPLLTSILPQIVYANTSSDSTPVAVSVKQIPILLALMLTSVIGAALTRRKCVAS